ncbi:26S proteasome non-ATPase regulatory subunit 1-like protein, partial [Euroglyphus maynei]
MKIFALDKLNGVVDEFWPEISDVIGKIEVLYEDECFSHRKLAALVASKVYYHLGSFEDSLTYALGAGELFNVHAISEYVDTIISKCIDHYMKLRVANAMLSASNSKESLQPIDPRLEDIVNRMFQRCFDDHQYKQAIGIALETRRMDMFEKAILQSNDLTGMLAYAFKITMSLIDNLHFRNEVLKILNKLYKNLNVPDYISMTQCLIFLDDDKSLAQLLDKLTRNDDSVLLAYQISFDLYESATQQFLSRIMESLRLIAPISSLLVKPSSSSGQSSNEENKEEEKMETDQPATTATEPKEVAESSKQSEPKKEDLSEEDQKRQDRIEKLVKILSGDISIELDLQFLIRNNHTDLLILKNTKDAVRNSVCHNAT